MDALEAILTRRSVRAFAPQALPLEQLEALINAAMHAPSAGNEQPWHFILITDPAVLARIPAIHPYATMAPQAAAGIVICGDLGLEKYPGLWVQDCAAATQNLLLAAHAQGLGAVWTAIHPMEDRVQGFRELLGLPKHVVPFALVPIGVPARPSVPATDRNHPDRIRRNHW